MPKDSGGIDASPATRDQGVIPRGLSVPGGYRWFSIRPLGHIAGLVCWEILAWQTYYTYTYMFVVNFDALAQASDFQIERRQVCTNMAHVAKQIDTGLANMIHICTHKNNLCGKAYALLHVSFLCIHFKNSYVHIGEALSDPSTFFVIWYFCCHQFCIFITKKVVCNTQLTHDIVTSPYYNVVCLGFFY